MDKILSARVDEMILHKISFLAQKLRVSKKRVIEGAVEMYAQKIGSVKGMNIFQQTSGAWRRKEPMAQTVIRAKSAFRKSLRRFS